MRENGEKDDGSLEGATSDVWWRDFVQTESFFGLKTSERS
jgi:hypothetical protein